MVRLAILVILLAAALSAQPASVDGVVVNRATGEPLSNVHISLVTGDFGNGGIDRVYGAISDKAGHFSVTGMKPDLYLVVLDRAGFLPVQAAGPLPMIPLTLKAGQNLTGHKLEMNPRAMIAGRVVDEYGDPVQGVLVDLRPISSDRESSNPAPGLTQRVGTNDRGEFRIRTSPGKYYVHASPQAFDHGVSAEVRLDGSTPISYAATYYPNAADTASAAVIEAGPGQDVAGIEIHLRRSSAAGHTLTIAGQVTGAPDGARANVTLRYGESPEKLYNNRSAAAAADGKFQFTGLEPGYYNVTAEYTSGKTGLQSLATKMQLDSSDRTDLQLTLLPGEELTGTLEIAGGAAPGVSVEKRTVRLQAAGFDYLGVAGVGPGAADKSGAFRLTNIHPGRFRVEVDPLPDNAFIKSITLDGAAVPDSTLDFSQGVSGSRLKIVVSPNGAQISGKVLGHDGDPLDTPLAQVMLWKDDKEVESDNANLVMNGEYSFKALSPGKYRVAALDIFELFGNYAPEDWDEATKALKAAAQEIELKEGDRIVKDLKVLGKEDIHVKPK
jgi:hypothetical protein